jgi:phosphate:Na+ symporter
MLNTPQRELQRTCIDWIELLGGIAIFIYGLQLASDGLQRRAEDQLRRWLTALTERPLRGLLSCRLLAAMLVSSMAIIIMLVGYTNVGLLSLPQMMGLLFGVGIGTTLVVQVMSCRLSDGSMLIVVIEFAIISFGKRGLMRAVGRAAMGFGLVFLAIQFSIEATSPLQQNSLLLQEIEAFEEQPSLGMLAGAGLSPTAVLHDPRFGDSPEHSASDRQHAHDLQRRPVIAPTCSYLRGQP